MTPNSSCLIVQTHQDTDQKLEQYVTMHGFRSCYWDDFKETPSLLFNNEPDLVLFGDISVPLLSGVLSNELEMFIRERQIPVVSLVYNQHVLIHHFEDVHFYNSPSQAQQMVLVYTKGHARRRLLREQLAQTLSAVDYLIEGEFCFQTIEEAQALAYFLSSLASKQKILRLGLTELFINAVEHGNLEIDSDEKEKLRRSGNWLHEIERRLQIPPYNSRLATLKFKKEGLKVHLTLQDQGHGFDWGVHISENATCAPSRKSGRGILIMQKSGFEELRYIGNGSTVECSFRIDKMVSDRG